MNFSDSEIVGSIMADHQFVATHDTHDADIIFLNTCSIRDNAEQRVRNRLMQLRPLKMKNPALIIGVLGCMAERLKEQLLEEEKYIDMIVGPDSYRDLPKLMQVAESGQKAINVMLSADETYADINPVRLNTNNVTAFISIMRGCENHCAYCVVPSTRGVERSRDPKTIVHEAIDLFNRGFREVTLLGQNVNSYEWEGKDGLIDFSELLLQVAQVNPQLRIRFATSHPKDLSDRLLLVMANHNNICKSIHLPVQSGSSRILKLMNRKYDRSWYMDRIRAIKKTIPDCAISTDIIAGFCTETDEDHNETLSLMEWAAFDYAYMFKYSERPGTLAAKKYTDDVPDEIKSRRLEEIIKLQQGLSLRSNRRNVDMTFEVLAEGYSKRSKEELMGRTSQNKVVVFNARCVLPGQYVNVAIKSCTAATLRGSVIL